jgi:putative hemolysin
MSITALVFALVALLLLGIFAGVEVAFLTANKLNIELQKKNKKYAAGIWTNYFDNQGKFLRNNLVVQSLLLVLFGMLVGALVRLLWVAIFDDATIRYGFFLELLFDAFVATVAVLLIDINIRYFFKAKANSVLSNGLLAYIVTFFYGLFNVLGNWMLEASEWLLRNLFNVKLSKKQELFGKADTEQVATQTKSSVIEDTSDLNKELFENALQIGEVKLRECLIPRKEIVGIEKASSITQLQALFVETQLSKLIVYDKNIDDIIGYVHQLDMFKKPTEIEQILLPIPTVPETMAATDLMSKFTKERKSIAWVIDEFGGTAGIVAMEDLLEELFGDIKDEYDEVEEFEDKQISENEYMLNGRMELDAITEKYAVKFNDEVEAGTLSGYIIEHNENLPKERETIIVDNYEFTIVSMSNTKIETVLLKVLKR